MRTHTHNHRNRSGQFSRTLAQLAVLTLVAALAVGCVKQSEYDALQAKYDESQALLTECQGNLEECNARADGLASQKAKLEDQLSDIMAEKGQLESSVAEMKKAIAEYKRREAEAKARMDEYRNLLARFKEMVDAGKLKVKIRDGRMVVELASDVLFESGKATLSEEGEIAIREVAGLLSSIPERKFQVEGHTDNEPISTAKYPSNWELSSGRALTVVHTMIEAGMPPNRVSAAGFGDTLPVQPNTSPQGRAANRRIEIVLVPDLSQLPGFDELQKLNTET